MPNALTSVEQQAVFILPSSSELPSGTVSAMLIPHGSVATYSSGSVAINSSGGGLNIPRSESRVLRTTLSSVPVVWQSELSHQYRELGQALNELTELEKDNQWKIDAPVYQVACHVAADLLTHSYPAPNIFTHGPKS